MALSRKFLGAMGIEGDKVDEIINAHADTVDALKKERDDAIARANEYKVNAEMLPIVQKELEELKTANGLNPFEGKYNELKEQFESLKSEYDNYKNDVTKAEVRRTKESAYKRLLRDSGIAEKRIDKILKVTDLEDIVVDNDGKIKDEEGVKKSIEEEWGDFVGVEHKLGASVSNPPSVDHSAPRGRSRAAEIAAEYHANLYGSNNREV